MKECLCLPLALALINIGGTVPCTKALQKGQHPLNFRYGCLSSQSDGIMFVKDVNACLLKDTFLGDQDSFPGNWKHQGSIKN
ncbi:hypothetical protein MKW92_006329 [Papaver armeniacum]|nr:hypothetical protein MKW92_006329 [Papaver armeniacum]